MQVKMHSNRANVCMEPDKHKTCLVLLVIYDLLLAGVQLHFSGHWYIEGDSHQGLFKNKAINMHTPNAY